MKKYLKVFVLIEFILFIFAIISVLRHPNFLIASVIGFILVVFGGPRFSKTHTFWSQSGRVIGVILLFLTMFSNIWFWFMLGIALLFLGLSNEKTRYVQKKMHLDDVDLRIIETIEAQPKNGRRTKTTFFGDETIGQNEKYEWDDININVGIGDTIIDLGNTLLPKEESIILVRKVIGRTRILVPMDVGVHIIHSTCVGKMTFDGESFELKNETMNIYSDGFDEATRHIKIATDVLIGNLEVIRV
jgi:predicted membrane protein